MKPNTLFTRSKKLFHENHTGKAVTGLILVALLFTGHWRTVKDVTNDLRAQWDTATAGALVSNPWRSPGPAPSPTKAPPKNSYEDLMRTANDPTLDWVMKAIQQVGMQFGFYQPLPPLQDGRLLPAVGLAPQPYGIIRPDPFVGFPVDTGLPGRPVTLEQAHSWQTNSFTSTPGKNPPVPDR